MGIFFNNTLVNETQTIHLVNDFSNQTYPIVCASVNSKPDVSLTLFDQTSLRQLSNNINSVSKNSCTGNLCTNILQVNFQFTDNSFNNMTSLACSAKSSNPNVPLYTAIYRNVIVQLTSNLFILLFCGMFFQKS